MSFLDAHNFPVMLIGECTCLRRPATLLGGLGLGILD